MIDVEKEADELCERLRLGSDVPEGDGWSWSWEIDPKKRELASQLLRSFAARVLRDAVNNDSPLAGNGVWSEWLLRRASEIEREGK